MSAAGSARSSTSTPRSCLAVALARRLGTPVKWIEERSENAARDDPRPGLRDHARAGRDEGRQDHLDQGRRNRLDGGVPPARHARYPAARCLDLRRRRTPSRTTASRSPASSRTRRRPTHTAAPAGPRRPTCSSGRWTCSRRSSGSTGSSCGARNFISEFPATLASGLTIDSGDYHASLDKLLEHLGLDELETEQQARRDRGDTKQIGVGFSTYNEMCGLAPSRILGAIRYAAGGWETATIRCLPTGTFQVVTGTSPHGQGHETAWSQIVADQLGCDPSEVEVLHGDTSISPYGLDTYGSRSLPVGRRRALDGGREDHREGAGDRGAPARGRRQTTSTTQTAPSR